jgi:hypothetical protein
LQLWVRKQPSSIRLLMRGHGEVFVVEISKVMSKSMQIVPVVKVEFVPYVVNYIDEFAMGNRHGNRIHDTLSSPDPREGNDSRIHSDPTLLLTFQGNRMW